MHEPVRLVCPECDLAHRVKRPVPERIYKCKRCGNPLPVIHIGQDGVMELRAPDPEAIAAAHAARTAPSPTADSTPPTTAPVRRGVGNNAELEKLTAIFQSLAERLDEIRDANMALPGELSDTGRKLLEAAERLEKGAAEQDNGVVEQIRGLETRISGLAEKLDMERIDAISGQIHDTVSLLAAKMEESLAGQRDELSELLLKVKTEGDTPPAVNADDLAQRLVSELKTGLSASASENGSAVDALARVADQLVHEQNGSNERMERLAAEIREAATSIGNLGEWRAEIPTRVADEIGKTIEDRVVGPVSTALAKQAPAILSEIQDNRLVDVVSRSVREAQRPLLREVLAGGNRGGVPVWLFAAVLLPLLLILGYLFLPGEYLAGQSMGEIQLSLADAADSLGRLETSGLPLSQETEQRLRNIDARIQALYDEALESAESAAVLEKEAENLRKMLEANNALIKDYEQTVTSQSQYIEALKAQLHRLGVTPAAGN